MTIPWRSQQREMPPQSALDQFQSDCASDKSAGNCAQAEQVFSDTKKMKFNYWWFTLKIPLLLIKLATHDTGEMLWSWAVKPRGPKLAEMLRKHSGNEESSKEEKSENQAANLTRPWQPRMPPEEPEPRMTVDKKNRLRSAITSINSMLSTNEILADTVFHQMVARQEGLTKCGNQSN